MRTHSVLLGAALLLCSVGKTHAWALDMVQSGGPAPGTAIAASDTLVFDVYLDAEPDLGELHVAVLFDDDGILEYVRGASSMPSYILYKGRSPSYLVSTTYPLPPQLLDAPTPPGKSQVDIGFLEHVQSFTPASGTGIWIATLVFQATGAIGDGSTTVELALLDDGSTTVWFFDFDSNSAMDASTETPTTGSFSFVTAVPEPATLLLIGLGLLGVHLGRARGLRGGM